VSNRLFRTMRVTQVSQRGPFREISLTSVASWTPGDKIQLRVARDGLTMRTYTPVRWDNTTGDTTILSYLHGAGPGSPWAQNAAADDSVQVIGVSPVPEDQNQTVRQIATPTHAFAGARSTIRAQIDRLASECSPAGVHIRYRRAPGCSEPTASGVSGRAGPLNAHGRLPPTLRADPI
jgi:NADPH-dependent ferric siderophore reductase